jgi:hypothetical protein
MVVLISVAHFGIQAVAMGLLCSYFGYYRRFLFTFFETHRMPSARINSRDGGTILRLSGDRAFALGRAVAVYLYSLNETFTAVLEII